MSTPLKAVFSVLLLAAVAGAGFSAWAILQIRGDLAALSAKVSQIERRPAAEPGAPMREAFEAPSGQPTGAALPNPSEIDALRRQVADLSTRVRALSGGAPAGAAPSPGGAGSPVAAALPAPISPTFDDLTREAIKNVVREAMAEEPAGAMATVSFSAPVMGGFNDIDSLAKELGLSETQKAEIQKVWAEREKEMQSMWAGTGDLPEPSAMEAKMKEMSRKSDERIKQLLTVEQAKKYDESKPQHGDAIFFGVKARKVEGGENK